MNNIRITSILTMILAAGVALLFTSSALARTNGGSTVILSAKENQRCLSNCVRLTRFDQIDVIEAVGPDGDVLDVATVRTQSDQLEDRAKVCDKIANDKCDDWWGGETPDYSTCQQGPAACVEVYEQPGYDIVIVYDTWGTPTIETVETEEDEEDSEDD